MSKHPSGLLERFMIKKLLNTQTKSVSFASLILAGFSVASGLIGLLRDRLLAGRIGTEKLDVYYAAFTVPDFIALILVFGAISAAIIPIFSGYLVKSKDQAWEYASALLNIFLVCLIAVCLVFIIFAPFFVNFIAPGFSEEKKEMTVLLMRIMFLSPILLGISNIISGILQVFHRFLVTAMAPVMYNLGIIFGIIFFVPTFGLPGLAWGVVLGGCLHILIQLPVFFYSGFKYRAVFNFKHPGVVKTLKLMVPRSLGLGAGQFNTIVTTAIASTLITGSVAVFNLANNLSNMLVSALAISLSTAIFPSLSLAYLKEDKTEFERKFSNAFLQLVFLTIPASVLIFLLRAQIVRVVLGTGRFGWIDTRLTAACLGVFSLGLCAQGMIFLLSKTFYAAHNTKIPAIISVATVMANIAMSLLIVWILQFEGLFFKLIQFWLKLQDIANINVVGLALAFCMTAILEALLLLYLLYRNYHTFKMTALLPSLCKIAVSSIIMGCVVFLVRQGLIVFHIVELQTFFGVFLQLALSGIAGVVVYLLSSFFLKSAELKTIVGMFFRKN